MIVGQNSVLNQYVPTFYVEDLLHGQGLVYDSVKKAFVNTFNMGSVAVPVDQIAYGNAAGNGITSSPNFTYNSSTGAVRVGGTTAASISAVTGQSLSIASDSTITLRTNNTARLRLNADGSLEINSAVGTAGQVLTSAGPGAPAYWSTVSAGGGGVTSVGVSSTNGRLTVTGSPITTSGTIDVDLSTSGVVPGIYYRANIAVDAYGRITGASDGSPSIPPMQSFQLSYLGSGLFNGVPLSSWFISRPYTTDVNFVDIDSNDSSRFVFLENGVYRITAIARAFRQSASDNLPDNTTIYGIRIAMFGSSYTITPDTKQHIRYTPAGTNAALAALSSASAPLPDSAKILQWDETFLVGADATTTLQIQIYLWNTATSLEYVPNIDIIFERIDEGTPPV